MHGFFLEIPDEAVNDLGVQEVHDKHAIEEDALGTDNHELHEPTRLTHFHERE